MRMGSNFQIKLLLFYVRHPEELEKTARIRGGFVNPSLSTKMCLYVCVFLSHAPNYYFMYLLSTISYITYFTYVLSLYTMSNS